MPYHQEIELKLALPEKDLHRVEDAPLLQGAIASARKAQLSSVYFDTPKFKLRQSGVSLRIHRQRDVGAAARRLMPARVRRRRYFGTGGSAGRAIFAFQPGRAPHLQEGHTLLAMTRRIANRIFERPETPAMATREIPHNLVRRRSRQPPRLFH